MKNLILIFTLLSLSLSHFAELEEHQPNKIEHQSVHDEFLKKLQPSLDSLEYRTSIYDYETVFRNNETKASYLK